jgi:hypothetical protein
VGICDVGLYPLEVEVSKSRKKHYEGGKNLKTAFCRIWKRAKNSKIKASKPWKKNPKFDANIPPGGLRRRTISAKCGVVEISKKGIMKGEKLTNGSL